VLLDKLLPKLKAEGHRVLIFSQFTTTLDHVQDFLAWRGHAHERLDGTTKAALRQAAIDRFSDPASDCFVFLLSTRAGGVGINLTAADTVVLFDSDWNPQNDVQAMARSHRIGQTKRVRVFRLVARNTYEAELVQSANRKLGLERALRQQGGSSEAGCWLRDSEGGDKGPRDAAELERLLRAGARDIFLSDERGEDFQRFDESDIEQILAGGTLVRHDSAAAGDGDSLFSKASFVANAGEARLDLDDPDFWSKLLQAQPPPEAAGPEYAKRQPKRTRRLGMVDLDAALEDVASSGEEGTDEEWEAGQGEEGTDEEEDDYAYVAERQPRAAADTSPGRASASASREVAKVVRGLVAQVAREVRAEAQVAAVLDSVIARVSRAADARERLERALHADEQARRKRAAAEEARRQEFSRQLQTLHAEARARREEVARSAEITRHRPRLGEGACATQGGGAACHAGGAGKLTARGGGFGAAAARGGRGGGTSAGGAGAAPGGGARGGEGERGANAGAEAEHPRVAHGEAGPADRADHCVVPPQPLRGERRGRAVREGGAGGEDLRGGDLESCRPPDPCAEQIGGQCCGVASGRVRAVRATERPGRARQGLKQGPRAADQPAARG